MPGNFRNIPVNSIKDNVFEIIGNEWMLITAGNRENFNAMTASWGTAGILWHLPVAICFIRPQRYTFGYAESSEYFTLNFLGKENREILQFCGTRSGRDTDKIAETGLLPGETELGNVYFEQSRLVLECKKLYSDFLKEDQFNIAELIPRNYPKRDFHKFYIGQVVNCLLAKKD